jgi:hypothetical protein
MRLRIGIEGKLMGVLPIRWTFVARDVDQDDAEKALWVVGFVNGITFKTGIIAGTTFATLS